MRLTLRFDVFVVSHSPIPTQNSIERSDQSVNRQVGLRRRVEVLRCHCEFLYGWRSSTTGKHVWRPLPTSPVHAHRARHKEGLIEGFVCFLPLTQDGRRGSPRGTECEVNVET